MQTTNPPDDDPARAFSSWIKQAMETTGFVLRSGALDVRRLSTEAGIPPVKCKRLTTGHALPDPAQCLAVAGPLGVPVAAVLRAAGHAPDDPTISLAPEDAAARASVTSPDGIQLVADTIRMVLKTEDAAQEPCAD